MSLVEVVYADSPNLDAFGKLRVSNSETLFDSKICFNDPDIADNLECAPLFFDNAEVSGSGTSTTYNDKQSSQTISVGSSAGRRVRQTRQRFNYQPGKSQYILLSYNLNGGSAFIRKREGIFDDDNGIFLELNGPELAIVTRSSASGSPVDTRVVQSRWNISKLDGSDGGPTLDVTKTQILSIDYEWLGVGRSRIGFVIDGKTYLAHEFLNANNLDVVYMSTPNLPLRSEIENLGGGSASSMTRICSTVISEGGSQEIGVTRSISSNGTHVVCTSENTVYAILGMRLRSAYLGVSVKLISTLLQIQNASKNIEWFLLFNPTVDGTFTFVAESQSAIEVARGASANTVTGGYRLSGGYLESGAVSSGANGSGIGELSNALRLGSLIDGTSDIIVLCARPIGGTSSVNVEGMINFRELV